MTVAEQPKGTPTGTGAAALFVLAASAVVSLTASSEGKRLKPYRDPANIVSWCYGETRGTPKASYTDVECAALLQNRLAASFAPEIAKCLPQLGDKQRVKVFGAFLDAAYNAGSRAACSSRMAAAVRRGDLPLACASFRGWYVTAHYRGKPEPAAVMRRAGWTWTGSYWRKVLPGLVTRRAKESQLCASGL
jgi:GH24 family phage-related lysozyme (muramidase)